MTDMIDQLSALLEECKARVTFDSERSIAKPCMICGTTDSSRDLIKIGTWTLPIGGHLPGDAISRPMCTDCHAMVIAKAER